MKTRKRNVAVPHDPAGFTESVLTLLEKECAEDDSVSDKLASAVKALAASNLDFSRYGVEMFEIFFAGARMGIGTKLADDTKTKISWNVRYLLISVMMVLMLCWLRAGSRISAGWWHGGIFALVQILACKAEVDDIMPFVKAFHNLARRRPFLVQRLEEVLKKLLTSAEFFDDDGRQKIAIGAPLLSYKQGI